LRNFKRARTAEEQKKLTVRLPSSLYLGVLEKAKAERASLTNVIEALLLAWVDGGNEALELFPALKRKYSNLLLAKRIFESLLSCDGKKMFSVVTRTWNPVTGCTHVCRYCWARRLAATKLKSSPRYSKGFVPRFNEEELKVSFKPGEVVFVSDMGDLFCGGVPDKWIIRVLEHVAKFPDTHFLFLTKNPERYRDFLDRFPPNSILGATLETNRDDLYVERAVSYAPLPSLRYEAMRSLNWDKKFVSIEPILDFDLDEFAEWIFDIFPFMVYLGYDNYNNKLPEPPLKKTLELVKRLSEHTLVVRKTIRPAWFETMKQFAGGENG